MQTYREDLISMGADPGDDNFIAMLLGSLPSSYDPYLAALTATSALLATKISPDVYIRGIGDEADRRSLKHRTKGGDKEVAFGAKTSSKGGRFSKGKDKANVECFNCHKKGHVKADFWAKGGGKEGQGPKGKGKRPQANAAKDNDADDLWMANASEDDMEWEEMVMDNLAGWVEVGNE
jgi:hypothetical protein